MPARTPPQGRLDIAVRGTPGQAPSVHVRYQRPPLAAQLLRGCRPAEAVHRLGLLFALCGTAQQHAATLACAAAAGQPETAPADFSGPALLGEWARELAAHFLFDPAGAPERPVEVSAAARQVLRPLQQAGSAPHTAAAALAAWLETHVLGEAPQDWQTRTAGDFGAWLAARPPAARHFEADAAVRQPADAADLPTASALQSAELAELATQLFAPDAAGQACPLWRGRPAMTGPLARQRRHAGLAAWLARHGGGADAHRLARLIELAELPARLGAATRAPMDAGLAGAWRLPDGTGVAGVDTARGLLLHFARLDAGRVSDYRIVPPTAWNFHPHGALAQALGRLPADARLAERCRRLVRAFDPCVEPVLSCENA